MHGAVLLTTIDASTLHPRPILHYHRNKACSLPMHVPRPSLATGTLCVTGQPLHRGLRKPDNLLLKQSTLSSVHGSLFARANAGEAGAVVTKHTRVPIGLLSG
jgi:hypothetical protein